MKPYDEELYWDWSQIDPRSARFPKDFLWGAATAAHQVEGGNQNNNWSRWENSTTGSGKPHVRDWQKSGQACDHWNRFREDVRLLQDIGVRAYRFSVEWSRVQPRQGVYDAEAIAHYHQMIDALLEAGIQPVLTIHHFTQPIWFEDLGGFEVRDNLRFLVQYGRKLFEEFSGKVSMWCTINEAEVFALMGWGAGEFPPGKRSPWLAARVLKHLALAHTDLYEALKSMPRGDRVQIGLVKNICQFEPWNRRSLLDRTLARILNLYYNDALLGYAKTGNFELHIPWLLVDESFHDSRGPKSLDFIGLNYYSHIHVSPWGGFRFRPQDTMTDMPYAIYPEGFYRALHQIREVGKPIYVTENGIADARDDRRALFIERYLYAMSRAIEEGCDVRGYFYWSLLDNFEWAFGYHMKFGLYDVDFLTQQRRLRAGSAPFVQAARGEAP